MRVAPRHNLTVTLIRLQRFGLDTPRPGLEIDAICRPVEHACHPQRVDAPRVDRVVLSRESCEHDPWSTDTTRAGNTPAPEAKHKNSHQVSLPTLTPRLSPVVGAPALAGLGVSLIVPGTLLDVVA